MLRKLAEIPSRLGGTRPPREWCSCSAGFEGEVVWGWLGEQASATGKTTPTAPSKSEREFTVKRIAHNTRPPQSRGIVGLAAPGLSVIRELPPALRSPVSSLAILTTFGDGLSHGAGLFIMAAGLLVVNTLAERPLESLWGLGLVALGLPAYASWRRHR
jgi:hypothetical protein